MRTNSIQNRSEPKIEVRANIDSSSNEALFNEFSKTLDEIAIKVFQDKDAIPAEPKAPTRKPQSKQDAQPKPEPIIHHHGEHAKPAVDHDAKGSKEAISQTGEKPKKNGEKVEKTGQAPEANPAAAKEVVETKSQDTIVDEVSDEEQKAPEEAASEGEESPEMTEENLDGEKPPVAEDVVVSMAASQVAVQQQPEELEPVKDSEQGEESEGEDTELPQPFSDVPQNVESSDTGVDGSKTKTNESEVPETVSVQQATEAPSAELKATPAEGENIAVQNIVLENPLPATAKPAGELQAIEAEKKIAEAFARVMQDMLLAEQNNQASQQLTKSLHPAAVDEAASVLKKLYGAGRLQEVISASGQSQSQQAQGLQINAMGAFSKADSAQFGDGKASAKPLPRAAEMRTMEKVENALKEIARSKDGKTISVRLDPPELGTVKIDMSIRDGGLHARLVAESPQVNNMLREKSHEVVQMLRKIGINAEKITVTVGSGAEQFDGGTANSFESFKQREGGDSSHKGQGNGNRAHGAMMTAGRPGVQMIKDDHWIA